MTFVIAFLLGSMFGVCVGFITAGAVREVKSSNDGTALTAERHPDSDALIQIDGRVSLVP